jgi:hypothetical protein
MAQLTGWVTSMDNFMAQLQMVNQVVYPSKQDQTDTEVCLLLALNSRNDTVSANPYRQMLQKLLPQSWTNVRVNSVMALSCCTAMLPHVAQRVQDQVSATGWDELKQSPNLLPCDFQIFVSLMKALRNCISWPTRCLRQGVMLPVEKFEMRKHILTISLTKAKTQCYRIFLKV